MAEPEDDADGPAQPQTVDVADPRAQRRQRKQQEITTENADAFWNRVFADPVGRSEMWAILSGLGTFKREFGHFNGLPHEQLAWYAAGQKDFGQTLYHSWLKAARDGVNLMLDEHHPDFVKPKAGKAKTED
jgi:hypothetical protein